MNTSVYSEEMGRTASCTDCGLSCQYQNHEVLKLNVAVCDLNSYIQDALII